MLSLKSSANLIRDGWLRETNDRHHSNHIHMQKFSDPDASVFIEFSEQSERALNNLKEKETNFFFQ